MTLILNHLGHLPSRIKTAWVIAIYELRTRFAGTALGPLWVMLLPLSQIVTYWFVFSVGFKIQTQGTVPFILYFLSGFAIWTFFSEAVISSIGVVTSNPHLVKKVVFPVEVMVITKIFVSGITHLIIVFLTLVAMLVEGRTPDIDLVSLVYFWAAAALLASGLGWALAAFNVFFRDIGQAASVLVGMWFWFTPVVWTIDSIPEHLRRWLYLNPMVYIVEGYRTALFDAPLTVPSSLRWYFWAVTLCVFGFGALLFRRLKPDFAELL